MTNFGVQNSFLGVFSLFIEYLRFFGHFYASNSFKLVEFRGRTNIKFFVGLVISARHIFHIPMELVECVLLCVF